MNLKQWILFLLYVDKRQIHTVNEIADMMGVSRQSKKMVDNFFKKGYLNVMKEREVKLVNSIKSDLIVESPAFKNDEYMPVEYTGRGVDISPELRLKNISPKAKSIAIIMDDLDHPISGYNHWIIWNIPVQEVIPAKIPAGEVVKALGGATQGRGYGKNVYRGPKPPIFMKSAHRYPFHVYVLDNKLNLKSNAKKKDLLEAMDSHILQHGVIVGKFKNK